MNTNSRYKNFCQTFFTAGDEDQFQSHRDKSSGKPIGELGCEDEDEKVFEKYRDLSGEDVTNTFRYIFHKFKKGIYIRIKNNELVTFLPFSKAKFVNEWSHKIKIDPSSNLINFFKHVHEMEGTHYPFDEEKINKSIGSWYANNYLLRYEYPINESDTGTHHMKSMFEELCAFKSLPDVELFINRRDFPLLKRDGTEPYEHIWDSNSHPLVSHNYEKYVPILSSVTRDDFADIPIPTLDDWARVKAGDDVLFPKTEKRNFEDNFDKPFHERKLKAVFRGASTGAGVTVETNMRLKVAKMSLEHPDILDAGITNWNVRPRKLMGEPFLKTLEVSTMPFKLVNKMTPTEQAGYKYIINIDGHVSAFRLSMEMNMGSVILLVDSDYKLWFRPLMKPFVHFVPVEKDLSDLIEKIHWCMEHEEECLNIVANAKLFYKSFLQKDGIFNFLQKKINVLARHFNFSYKESCLQRQLKFEKTWLSDSNFLMQSTENTLIASTKLSKIFLEHSSQIAIKHSSKTFENIHEAFVGLSEINHICKEIPNFNMIRGFDIETSDVFTDYIPSAVNMLDWLNSPDFNTNDLFSVLTQLSLALNHAQNNCGFIHYDLFPWNIMIVQRQAPATLKYITAYNQVATISTKILPVIIDYGKSHVISNGLHFGFINMFSASSIQDILSLTVSICNVLIKRKMVNLTVLFKLTNFFANTKFLPEKIDNVSALKKFLNETANFSHLISCEKFELEHKTPLNFFSYLQGISNTASMSSFLSYVPKQIISKNFGFLHETANVYYFFQMYKLSDNINLFKKSLAESEFQPVHKAVNFHELKFTEETFLNPKMCLKLTEQCECFFDLSCYLEILKFILVYRGPFEVLEKDRIFLLTHYKDLLSGSASFLIKRAAANRKTFLFYKDN